MQTHEFEKDKLQSILKLSDEIYYSTGIPEFLSDKISQLSILTYSFDYMELDRKMMLHYHQRACEFKQKVKKDEAWKRAKDYVQKIKGHSSMILSRDFKS